MEGVGVDGGGCRCRLPGVNVQEGHHLGAGVGCPESPQLLQHPAPFCLPHKVLPGGWRYTMVNTQFKGVNTNTLQRCMFKKTQVTSSWLLLFPFCFVCNQTLILNNSTEEAEFPSVCVYYTCIFTEIAKNHYMSEVTLEKIIIFRYKTPTWWIILT